MTKYTLESILSEILNERENLSPEIIKKIDRFGELNMEMEKAREKLDSIRREYKNIESELLPILEELDEYSTRTIKTNRYLIHIKKMGFNRTMFQYARVLDEVLKGANEETKKMVDELLEATATVQRVAASIGVQKIGEGFLDSIGRKIKGMIQKLSQTLKVNNKNMDTVFRVAKKIYDGKNE